MKHVIIGGGIAGLYIGYQLYKMKKDFIILEKNSSLERGRLFSINSNKIEELTHSGARLPSDDNNDNFILELGASVIHENQKNIMKLVKELNLTNRLQPLSNKTKTYFVHPKLSNKDAKEKWKILKQNLFSNLTHLPPDYTLEEAAKTIFNEEDFETFKLGVMEWYEVNLQNARVYKKEQSEEGQYYSFKNGIEEIVTTLTKLLKKYIYFGYEANYIQRHSRNDFLGTAEYSIVCKKINTNSNIGYGHSKSLTTDKNKIVQIEADKVYLCTSYTCAKNQIKYYNLQSVYDYLNLGFDRCCYRFYVYFNRPLNVEYGYIYGDFELKWSIRINPQLWMITYVDGPLSCKLNDLKPMTLIKKWITFINSTFNEKLTINNIVYYKGGFWKDAYTVLSKKFYNLKINKETIPKDKYGLYTPRQNKYYGEIIRDNLPSTFVCTVLPKDLGENTAWIEGHLFNI